MGTAAILDVKTSPLPGNPRYVQFGVVNPAGVRFQCALVEQAGARFQCALVVQVSGYVRSAETAGNLPNKDAVVEYSFSFGGKNYRGSTLTDADGFYSLTILVC